MIKKILIQIHRLKKDLEGYSAVEALDYIESYINILQREQPEVDLEKETEQFLNETGAPYLWCNDDDQKEWCNVIARHFYELGLNARKEE